MFQFTRILPRSDWQDVIILENNEPVVDIQTNSQLILGKNLSPYNVENYTARKTVVDMLTHASSILPPNYILAVVEGVRTLAKQKEH